MKIRSPLLALTTFICMTSINWTPDEIGIRLSDSEVVKLHGTDVTPVLDHAVPKGQNVLWCASFQMAWDDSANHFGRPMKLTPDSQLADKLNQHPFDRRWVDDDSVFTAQGLVDEGVFDRIDQGVQKRTGSPSKLLDQIKPGSAPNDLVFFALLQKDLQFPQPFGQLGSCKMGDKTVPWFGFMPQMKDAESMRQQVLIHHHAAKDDFVVELLCKQTGDQLLLAKLPDTPKTMAGMSESVLKRLRADAPSAGGADLLAVPNVIVDEAAAFEELQDKTVVGTTRFIRHALQSIEFQMNEDGVKLRSEANVSFGCSKAVEVNPRLMILEPPFAIVMKRKEAPQPYFAAWIANADLLEAK